MDVYASEPAQSSVKAEIQGRLRLAKTHFRARESLCEIPIDDHFSIGENKRRLILISSGWQFEIKVEALAIEGRLCSWVVSSERMHILFQCLGTQFVGVSLMAHGLEV